ncbi:Mur ligase family protein [Alkalibacillus aidingensis]|uniref:Mur ligase family protein n=1 Tax=Alkalibacillus aidingensis TaxID=2747607 RepID=UPI001660557F|nr:UDP-N-acetylmuramyl-tripeptide synthetase [Alkalibacillus aidingensis]
MRLETLLQAVNVSKTFKAEDVVIEGIAYHSQKVKQGDLFVCVRGLKTDGHKYLGQAMRKGAVAAVVEEFQEDLDIPQYLVEDSRLALARLAAKFYNNPSKKLNMIGITATNGKTTTTYMTNAILERQGYKTGMMGTVTVKIDDLSIPAQLTTPESLDLQQYLSQMYHRGVSHVSMEVSSQALEMNRVEQVDYDIVTMNNISREHIDAHGSFERYFDIKSSLIRHAKPDAFAVLNMDCPYTSKLVDQTEANVLTYSVNNDEGDLICENLDLSTGRANFTVNLTKPLQTKTQRYKPMTFDVSLAVPGLHSVYNAMMAICISLLSDVDVETIQETLKSFGGVERRFEFIYEDDIKVVDDHFANAGNIDVTLETLKKMDYRNLHLVYAIRGERGPTVNRENAEAIASWADELGLEKVIATKSESHVTDKDRVTQEEQAVFQEVMDQANIDVDIFDELPHAIDQALNEAHEGDLILLAGAQGMDSGASIALNEIDKRKKQTI